MGLNKFLIIQLRCRSVCCRQLVAFTPTIYILIFSPKSRRPTAAGNLFRCSNFKEFIKVRPSLCIEFTSQTTSSKGTAGWKLAGKI